MYLILRFGVKISLLLLPDDEGEGATGVERAADRVGVEKGAVGPGRAGAGLGGEADGAPGLLEEAGAAKICSGSSGSTEGSSPPRARVYSIKGINCVTPCV